MCEYNIVMETPDETVVAEYESVKKKSDAYQSEAALENEFVKMLCEQGYEYLPLRDEKSLVANLRVQLESLNGYKFTEGEWETFFRTAICDGNEGIVEKTRKIQDDYIQNLKKDDGSTKNIYLIDKKNIHNNRLQVINQYVQTGGSHENRYDVTILVNGLPLVHVELKRRGVVLEEAFKQINRYQKESFWAGSGLYEYVQIFVISNGTHTKYYSNTTRNSHVNSQRGSKGKKSEQGFEFTSFWADANNRTICDLVDFTRTFFVKGTLLNVLTKFCVLTSENSLLVMRPYQIAATERILKKIEIAENYKKAGGLESGGYIWHTTGSGKTLTSFKTAQLATNLPFVDKVLFVVDRKDLDFQTMKEYDRFEKGAANGNISTKILQRQIEDESKKIIVTTIQKLSIFVKHNKSHPAYQKRVVLIFDECHRSQFGEMHKMIVKNFKNYHIFGFTGTPIFSQNASTSHPNFCTTEQAFGRQLHAYTIVDAINDGNVLPFRVDFVNTVKEKEGMTDKEVAAINTEDALCSHERIGKVVEYIIEHFDQKTERNSSYSLDGKRLNGFNSILACSSIPAAKMYYLEFQRQLQEKNRDLTVATIFSYAPNEEADDAGNLDDEGFETDFLDKGSRDFLDFAIENYNKKFSTNFSSEGEGFQNYYKDLSERVKNREVDLLIVVNMFLTGFDATTLNTLWVDKNLRHHGLLQAFSRTNRILNSVKAFGNIVCFRNLQKETDDAIAMFGDKNAKSVVLLKTFEEYFCEYKKQIAELSQKFPLGEPIVGEAAEKGFIALIGGILRLRNILSCFDKFEGREILSERDFQDYLGAYNDLHQKYKNLAVADKESIKDDIIFELELVRQIEVNIDYILQLVEKYHESNCEDKEIRARIDKAVGASPSLRSKKEWIEGFISRINAQSEVQKDWKKFVREQKEADLQKLVAEENLDEKETRKFLARSFKEGEVKTIGLDIEKILPPMSRFDGSRTEKKQTIIDKILQFFEKFFGLLDAEETPAVYDVAFEKGDELLAAESEAGYCEKT